jgi:tetratricopeptide repeat protein
LTRHELKEQLQHDQFTDAVSNVVGYTSSHRRSLTQWGIAAGVVLILGCGIWWYMSYQRSLRQQDLSAALSLMDAPVGPPNDYAKTYATEDAKQQALIQALSGVVKKDGGSHEGQIAQYYLGTLKARTNDAKGAEADLRTVADSNGETSPLAKVALAQLYAGQNKLTEAQGLLRSIVNSPTNLVSKAQAQILLAQLTQPTDPKQAKAVLQSIEKTDRQRAAISRAADALSEQLTGQAKK